MQFMSTEFIYTLYGVCIWMIIAFTIWMHYYCYYFILFQQSQPPSTFDQWRPLNWYNNNNNNNTNNVQNEKRNPNNTFKIKIKPWRNSNVVVNRSITVCQMCVCVCYKLHNHFATQLKVVCARSPFLSFIDRNIYLFVYALHLISNYVMGRF